MNTSTGNCQAGNTKKRRALETPKPQTEIAALVFVFPKRSPMRKYPASANASRRAAMSPILSSEMPDQTCVIRSSPVKLSKMAYQREFGTCFFKTKRRNKRIQIGAVN